MTAQPALPDIDWTDVCGDSEPEPRSARYERDLDGQGLTALQRHTITDIEITGSYL